MQKNIYRIIFLIVGLVFISLNTITAQKTFEGKVKVKISAKGENVLMDYFIKGKNFKIEMGQGNEKGSFIMKGDKMILLMPAQKMYMEIDKKMMDKLQSMNPVAKKDNEAETNFDISKLKTGKTKKILGYNCEQWIIDDENGKIELWVTDELGNFMSMDSPMGQGYSPAWSSYLQNKGFFPMVVISNDGDKFEVIGVEKKSLSNNLFSPPADYRKMNLPGM